MSELELKTLDEAAEEESVAALDMISTKAHGHAIRDA